MLLLISCMLLGVFFPIIAKEESHLDLPFIYHSVNVITGEYCETQTDLTFLPPADFKIRRSYSSKDGAFWQFNLPIPFQTQVEVFKEVPFGKHLFQHQFDHNQRLTSTKLIHATKALEYHWLTFAYPSSQTSVQVSTSDNQNLEYTFEKIDSHWLLSEVKKNNLPQVKYTYARHAQLNTPLLTVREEPNQRYLINEYYEQGENVVGDQSIFIQTAQDFRIGRVRLQRAPVGQDATPVITHRYFYYNAFTEVIDALGNKVTYHYNNEGFLTAIETYAHYNGQYMLCRKERFFWQPFHDGLPSLLVSRTIEDSQGTILTCRVFSYNEAGKLISDTFFGNLSGKCTSSILLDTSGFPLRNGIESYTRTNHYSLGDDPLLLSQAEENGQRIRYLYVPGTRLIQAKLIYINKSVVQREIYIHDSDGRVVKTIADDGKTDQLYSLEGVTERRITAIQYKKENPGLGSVEEVSSSYWDPASGREILLKTVYSRFDSNGRLISQETIGQELEKKSHVQYTYDISGRLQSETDNEGQTISYLYDQNGNLASKQTIKESIDYYYDYSNRLIYTKTTLPSGQTLSQTFEYDYVGNKTCEIDTYGNQTRYEYDALGRKIKTIYPPVKDVDDAIVHPQETFTYDALNRLIKKIDPKGDETHITYSARSKPICIEQTGKLPEIHYYDLAGTLIYTKTSLETETHSVGDSFGRITSIVQKELVDGTVKTSSFEFNTFHLIRAQTEDDTTHFSYDGAGRLIAQEKVLSNGQRHRLEFTFDDFSQISDTKEIFGPGFGDFYHIQTKRDLNTHPKEILIFDADEQLVKHQILLDPPKNEAFFNTTWRINDLNQQVRFDTEVDKQGNRRDRTYDAWGRLVSLEVFSPLGELVLTKEWRWDLGNNKIEEKVSAKGKTVCYHFEYGPQNRLEKVIEAAGSTEQRVSSYTFDRKGQVSSLTKPDGTIIYYSYNGWGDLARLYASDQSIDYRYHYDKFHRLKQVEDQILHTFTNRDYVGSTLVFENQANGFSHSNQIDGKGRIISQLLFDNSKVDYTYRANTLQKIDRFSSTGHHLYNIQYEYDLQGRLIEMQRPCPGSNVSYHYKEDQLHSIQNLHWSEKIFSSKNGLIDSVQIQTSQDTSSQRYQYDSLSQLIKENDKAYDYDAFANRLEDLSVFNDLNELLEDKDYHYQYDLNGNLIAQFNDQSHYEYTYDALNRLTCATYLGHWKVEFSYDAFHRCLTRHKWTWDLSSTSWINAKVEQFIYDEEREIGVVDADGKITLRILGLGLGAEAGSSIAIETSNHIYFPIHDHRGSPSALIDFDSCQVAQIIRYDAFGNHTIIDKEGKDETCLSPWTFSSKRFDPDLELFYFGKRFYDPKKGRWLTKDPMGFIDGINRYTFVGNNPISQIDLYGLFSISAAWDRFAETAQSVFDGVYHFFDQMHTFIQNNFSYENALKNEMETLAELTFGKDLLIMMGVYVDPLEAGTYGFGEVNDKVRITLINGILNVRFDCLYSASYISKTHGNTNVHYIFHPSEGWGKDMMLCLAIKLGYVSPQARLLAKTWKTMINDMGGVQGGGLILHYAHSMGGTDTAMAKTLLTKEELKMIRVITFGSATLLDNQDFQNVDNYVSWHDGVPFAVDLFGSLKAIFSQANHVTFLDSMTLPLIDHAFTGDTYRTLVEAFGQVFIEQYGALSAFNN